MNLDQLESKGIAPEIIAKWNSIGYSDLLPVQEEAVLKGLFEGKSLLVTAPTSSGKTFIGEMAATGYTLQGRRSLYLVPFKALAEEIFTDFNERYGNESFGFIIRISDKDHRETDSEICVGNYDIAILTYEKLSSLLTVNPGLLDSCDCVIVDEVQMMMDPERGGNLELMLTKILSVSRVQIIALSAVLGKINGLDLWLKADLIQTEVRPVELRQGVILANGKYEYINWNEKTVGLEQFKNGSLFELVGELLTQDEQIIIVRNTVPETQRTALSMSEMYTYLNPAPRSIDQLSMEIDTETREALLKTLRHGVAFHNADCELAERRIVENGFRSGEIRIVVATTTLSMGVNMPCKTVILADNTKWQMVKGSLQLVPWLVSEVRNIFGRAGRLGKETDFGRGILFAENQRDYFQTMNGYIKAPLEPFISTFENIDLAERVLDVVATGFGGTTEEIIDFIFKTYAAKSWGSTEAIQQIKAYLHNGITKCLEIGLLEQLPTKALKATDLGRLCIAKGCSIETINILRNYILKVQSVDILDLCYAVASVKEVGEQFYRGVRWENPVRRERLFDRLSHIYSANELRGSILSRWEEVGNRMARDDSRYMTIALLAMDILTSHVTSRSLREGYSLSASNIRNICINLSWIIDTLSGIAEVFIPSLTYDISVFADCIYDQSPLDSRLLRGIGVDFSRDEKIKLVESGISSEDDFLDKASSDFRGIINPRKADYAIKHVNNKREKTSEYWAREHKRRLDALGYNVDIVLDLYTVKGIDLEKSIRELFETGFTNCIVTRITDQHFGEPDLLVVFPDSQSMTVQVTAKDLNTKFIDSKKSGDVVSQSARFHPNSYMCIGRPDFQQLAKEQAHHMARDLNFKLMPIYVFVELFARVKEGRVSSEAVTDFIRDSRGYLTVSMIDKYLSESKA